jgi:hypothetical protein
MRSTATGFRTAGFNLPPFSEARLFIERRAIHRIPVKGGLASFVSPGDLASREGDATLRNVSMQGCQLDSDQTLPQNPYQLIVLIPRHPTPILIHSAVTQWSSGGLHGIKFLEVAPMATSKLQEVVWCGTAPSWVLNTMRFGLWSALSPY